MTDTTNYEEILDRDGVLVQYTVGVSMLPMLKQHRDTVVIKKLLEKPKVNDVIFYKRDNGKYILHRIIKVTKDGYIIRGDNCYKNEYDITDKHILGVLTEFYKKEKHIDCKTNKSYKFYVVFWRATYYLRFVLRHVHILLSKIKKAVHDIFS